MIKKLLAAGVMLFGLWGTAEAATYYIADCQSGSAVGCTAGSNASATPTNPLTPWQTHAPVQTLINGSVACGDQFLFAKGGAWVNFELNLNSAAATAGATGCRDNPILIGSYDPTIWTSSDAPIIGQNNAGVDAIIFDDVSVFGGFTIQDLNLQGGWSSFATPAGQRGIVIAGNVHDVIIRRNTIHQFGNGIEGFASEDTSQRPTRCLVQDNIISNNARQGILWSCNYSVIEGNTFTNTGIGCTGTPACAGLHNVYLSGAQSENVIVRNNILLNNVLTSGASDCDATNLVVHGRYDELLIEGNILYQAPGTVTGGCWGIVVNGGYLAPFEAEEFERIKIIGNKIINHSNFNIAWQGMVRPLIANNQLIQEAGSADTVGIGWVDRDDPDDNDSKDIGAIVRNNTMYFCAPSNFNYGIYLQSFTNTNPGTEIQVTGNLMHFCSGASGNTGFAYDGYALANFEIADYNAVYFAGSGNWMSGASTLASAQAAGFDTNSINTNCSATLSGTTTGIEINIPVGSPCRGLVPDAYSERLDGKRCVRDANKDAGALEYFGSSCTPTPWPPGYLN
jgi:parallel beta-helix repeat protein